MRGKLALSFFTINRKPGDKRLLKVIHIPRLLMFFGSTLCHSWWSLPAPMFFFLSFWIFKKVEKGTIIGEFDVTYMWCYTIFIQTPRTHSSIV